MGLDPKATEWSSLFSRDPDSFSAPNPFCGHLDTWELCRAERSGHRRVCFEWLILQEADHPPAINKAIPNVTRMRLRAWLKTSGIHIKTSGIHRNWFHLHIAFLASFITSWLEYCFTYRSLLHDSDSYSLRGSSGYLGIVQRREKWGFFLNPNFHKI